MRGGILYRKETIPCIKQKGRNTISSEFHTLTSRAYFRHVPRLEIRIPYQDALAFCSPTTPPLFLSFFFFAVHVLLSMIFLDTGHVIRRKSVNLDGLH